MDNRLVDAPGGVVATCLHPAAVPLPGLPLLVALHGGTYNKAYFSVPGGPLGSFLEMAARNGFDVLTVDRPGYGQSTLPAEEENTFARQAEILDAVIADQVAQTSPATVVLVGHSIGGMIALEIAARQPGWPLVGVATSGMGARMPSGGAAEQLGSLPFEGVIELPIPDREGVMFGPDSGIAPGAKEAAQESYAPTPFVELVRAPQWARERLATVAGQITVPVHNVLAEHDALWDSSAEARAEFVAMFAEGAGAVAELATGTGHCLDHHLIGAASTSSSSPSPTPAPSPPLSADDGH